MSFVLVSYEVFFFNMTFEYFVVHLLFDINKKKLSINFYLRELNC